MLVPDLKVAVLDVSHWHAPLARAGLVSSGCNVVAVSGPESMTQDWNKLFGSRTYDTPANLIASEEVDFAFIFGNHREQTETALMAMMHGIGCSIEKPAGICADDVRRLIDLVDSKGIFASIPFVNRLGPIPILLRELTQENGETVHYSFTDIAGSPDRYIEAHCPWMLDPDLAGGGCLINLGVHFIDLFAHLSGGSIRLEGTALSNAIHAGAMEDHARLLLSGVEGKTAYVEVGYTHFDRDRRRQAYSFVGADWMVDAREGETKIDLPAGEEIRHIDLDAGHLYATYVEATLNAFSVGKPPIASLHDLHCTMKIVDEAYGR